MFFRRRATQAEYFDAHDRAEGEVAEFYASLARANRFFLFADPFQRLLPKFLGTDNCRSLSLLDLGGGDGSLASLLTEWAATKRGWDWRFTNLDINPAALRVSKCPRNVA